MLTAGITGYRLILLAAIVAPLTLWCIGSSAATATGTTGTTALRLGSDVWPPFTDALGKPRVALDLVQAALERSQIEARMTLIDEFTELIQKIRDGDEFDGSAALWRSEERERYLLFSRPYLENRLVLLARKGTDVSATSLASLVDKRVGIAEGYDYGETLATAPGPALVRGASDQTNLQALVKGELDYILVDELVVHALFERYGERADILLTAGTAPIIERPLHLAVRRDTPNAAALIERFNIEIQAMIADGSYNRLLGVTWVRVDLDGDGKSELVLSGVQAGSSPPESAYTIYGSKAATQGPDPDSEYVVDGKTYETWNRVPQRYKVSVERNYEGPKPGLVLFDF